jgi:tetratricopeptide (TPR) repeat protein
MRNFPWLAPTALCSTLLGLAAVSQSAIAQEISADKVSEPSSEELGSAIARALENFRSGHFREALTLFDAAVAAGATGDDRTTLAFNAAVCAYAIGDYPDAQRRFEALAVQPSKLSTLAEVHAGLAAVRADDLPAARRHRLVTVGDDAELQRAHDQLVREIADAELRSRRDHLRGLIGQGYEAIERGHLDRARRILQQAEGLIGVGTADDRADIRYGLGMIDYELGALDTARRHFEICIAARASDVEALLALGLVCEAQHDATCARRAYESAQSAAKPQQDRADAALRRLYGLPVGPSAFIAIGGGVDSNADQTGIRDLTGTGTSTQQNSAFVGGLLDASWLFQTSLQTALGPYYAADVIALLHETVRDLSVQTHELGLRLGVGAQPEDTTGAGRRRRLRGVGTGSGAAVRVGSSRGRQAGIVHEPKLTCAISPRHSRQQRDGSRLSGWLSHRRRRP